MKRNKMKSTCLTLLTLIALFFGYRHYRYGDFKRTYENGANPHEQLHTLNGYNNLLFGKQYVQAVKEAGYYIDEFNLIMMDRIPVLTTKKK